MRKIVEILIAHQNSIIASAKDTDVLLEARLVKVCLQNYLKYLTGGKKEG